MGKNMAERAVSTAKIQEKKQTCPNFCKQKSSFNSSGSSADRILQLQRTAGNQAVQRMIESGALQAKLKISQPNDIYEQEADRVAEQVMRMPDLIMQRQPLQVTPLIQRQVAEEKEALQAKETVDQSTNVTPSIESQISELQGGGQPLDPATRAFFEPRFGQNFREVRVHTDLKAAEAAKAVNAKAFTMGKDMVFGTWEYSPGSAEGKRLIGHELTHVMQQNEGGYHEGIIHRQAHSPDINSERRWSIDNPSGMVEQFGAFRWILWNFDVASTKLKNEHKGKLQEIAQEIWPLFKRYNQNVEIIIEGHASNTGALKNNKNFAQRRAEAVKEFLSSYHFEKNYMRVNSFGSSSPLSFDDTPEALAKNRRVDIEFVGQVKSEPDIGQKHQTESEVPFNKQKPPIEGYVEKIRKFVEADKQRGLQEQLLPEKLRYWLECGSAAKPWALKFLLTEGMKGKMGFYSQLTLQHIRKTIGETSKAHTVNERYAFAAAFAYTFVSYGISKKMAELPYNYLSLEPEARQMWDDISTKVWLSLSIDSAKDRNWTTIESYVKQNPKEVLNEVYREIGENLDLGPLRDIQLKWPMTAE